MPTYEGLRRTHDPATGTVAPHGWGDQVRDNFEALYARDRTDVRRTTLQSITASTWTVVSWSSAVDVGGLWSAGSPTQVTIQHPGWYIVTAHINWTNGNSGVRQIRLRLNGATIERTTVTYSTNPQHVLSVERQFTVGDVLKVAVRHTHSSSLSVYGDWLVLRRGGGL